MKALHVMIFVLMLLLLASCGNDDSENQSTFQDMDELWDYVYDRDWVFDVYLYNDNYNRDSILLDVDLIYTGENLDPDDEIMVSINGTQLHEYLTMDNGDVELEFDEVEVDYTDRLHIVAKYNGEEIFNKSVKIPERPQIADVIISDPDEKVKIYWGLDENPHIQVVAFSAYDGQDDDQLTQLVAPETRSFTIPANTLDVNSFYHWYAHVGGMNLGEQGNSTFFVSNGDDEDNYDYENKPPRQHRTLFSK